MSREIGWRELDRYLAGECSAEEAREVERWLAAEPERAELVAALRDAEAGSGDVDVDRAWGQLRGRMRQLDEGVNSLAERRRAASVAGRRRRERVGLGSLLRVAAVVLVMLGAGAGGWWLTVGGPGASVEEVATVRGERTTVSLPDGTEVVLGPESRLSYEQGLSGSTRLVELEGGAYFRVASVPERPFVVRTGMAETRVLGTEFDVQAHGDRGVQVVVAEGTVSLRARTGGAEEVILHEASMGRVDEDGVISSASGVDVDPYLAWLQGRLVLDDVSLRDALPRLERWFAIELRLADPSLGARRVTADVQGEALEHVLEVISLALGLRYEREGDRVTLYAGDSDVPSRQEDRP